MRFDFDFQDVLVLGVVPALFNELLGLGQVHLQQFLAIRAQVRIRPVYGLVIHFLIDLLEQEFLVANPLVAHTLFEELVEIEVVLHQEFQRAGVKLHDLLVHDLA